MYSNAQIAHACQAPVENVSAVWPHVLEALAWQGINDHPTRVAMAATIAVETGITVAGKNMTFLPITEIQGQYARYAPWYGRGLIQCTWESNYRQYGPRLSPPRDLIANPDILLEVVPSAQMAALYFKDRGIQAMAAAGNWQAVREAVNGGLNGWDVFYAAVQALLAIPESDTPLAYRTTVGIAGALKRTPDHGSAAAVGPDHKPVQLAVGQVVHFEPDPRSGKETDGAWAHLVVAGSPAHGWFLRDHLRTDLVDA